MHCSTCGAEVNQALSYCNRCGANLRPISNQPGVPPAKLVGAAWAISVSVTLVTLGGLGMLFALAMALITRGINLSGGGMVLVVLSLLAIFSIDWLLVRQLSRVLDLPLLSGGATQREKAELNEQPRAQIGAPPEPVLSVTEHTTRAFEPMPRERQTKR